MGRSGEMSAEESPKVRGEKSPLSLPLQQEYEEARLRGAVKQAALQREPKSLKSAKSQKITLREKFIQRV